MKTLLLLLGLLGLVIAAGAQSPRRCTACGTAASAGWFTFNSPTLGDKQPVCESCTKLADQCAICRMPVRPNARKLDDGRFFCERDHRSGVFDLNEARRIFEEARREAAGILFSYGTPPDRNITVSLVSGTELKKALETLPSVHGSEGTLGLTHSQWNARKQFTHRISLINGLPANHLAAVCAHEYTHAWLAENLPADRKLEKDTAEGFCELIAYKVMTRRRDEQQKKLILDNAYTRGQVNAFVEAEEQHHFHRIVKWVQTGVDDALFQTNRAQVLTLRPDEEPAAFVWPPPEAVRTKVPDTLTLKGISGSPSRRFALINDATLTKNEEAKVRVGSTNVLVRCLDIRAASVVIQIKGATQPTELFLANKD